MIAATGLTASTLIADRRALGPGTGCLIGFLVLVCAIAVSDVLDLAGLYRSHPLLEAVLGPPIRGATMLLAPLIFLFIDQSTAARPLKPDVVVHAIPAAVVCSLFLIVNAPDAWHEALFQGPYPPSAFGQTSVHLFWILFLGSAGVYLWRSFVVLLDHLDGLRNFFSSIPVAMLARLRFLWALILLPVASIVMEYAVERVLPLPETWKLVGGALRVTCIIVLCALILRAVRSDGPVRAEAATVVENHRRKYARAPMTDQEATVLAQRLETVMRERALYRDPLLSLRDVASAIRAQEHRVSQVLNMHLGTNFFDYVNRWRVEEAKQLLAKPSRMTVLDIALAVGFNARSTFYTAFRKVEGMTPREHRAHLKSVSEADGEITLAP